MIYVMTIALNEEKFIRASLGSVLKRDNVGGVVVVEGADKKYPGANDKGLSVDNTELKIKSLDQEKLIYIRHGWAESKTELRQKCISTVYKEFNPKPTDWGLFVDGDEVWSDLNWKKLTEALELSMHVGSVYFDFLHFWKTPDMVAVGGQWDSKLFRLFRFVEPNLRLAGHAHEPLCSSGKSVSEMYGKITTSGIYVHHYGYCKDQQDVQDKIKYYEIRDTHLNVKDTWTNWEKGQDTQPTHGGGSVEPFYGLHPIEIVEVYPEINSLQ